jgi:hypothetical protein
MKDLGEAKKILGMEITRERARGIVYLTQKQYVTSHPNDTQYCPLLALLNQTSQEVTHPGTAPTEARLTAKF